MRTNIRKRIAFHRKVCYDKNKQMFERGAPVESNFLVPGKQKLQIYEGEREQTLMEKLEILSDAAKYDVA